VKIIISPGSNQAKRLPLVFIYWVHRVRPGSRRGCNSLRSNFYEFALRL
jgi:hypothetical protein